MGWGEKVAVDFFAAMRRGHRREDSPSGGRWRGSKPPASHSLWGAGSHQGRAALALPGKYRKARAAPSP